MMGIENHVQVLLIPKIMSRKMYCTIQRMGAKDLLVVFMVDPILGVKKALAPILWTF